MIVGANTWKGVREHRVCHADRGGLVDGWCSGPATRALVTIVTDDASFYTALVHDDRLHQLLAGKDGVALAFTAKLGRPGLVR